MQKLLRLALLPAIFNVEQNARLDDARKGRFLWGEKSGVPKQDLYRLDGDNDIHYYRLMTAWSENERFSLNFSNAHDLNMARDSSQEESIKTQLRARFADSKLFIVLIGDNTRYLTKFVKWEIETAIRLGLPIIGVNLNGSRQQDSLCPPSMRDTLAIYVPYKEKIVSHAAVNWPGDHVRYSAEGKTGPFYYYDSVYQSLGL